MSDCSWRAALAKWLRRQSAKLMVRSARVRVSQAAYCRTSFFLLLIMLGFASWRAFLRPPILWPRGWNCIIPASRDCLALTLPYPFQSGKKMTSIRPAREHDNMCPQSLATTTDGPLEDGKHQEGAVTHYLGAISSLHLIRFGEF